VQGESNNKSSLLEFGIAEPQPILGKAKDSARRIFVQAAAQKELVLIWVRRSQKWKISTQ